MTSSSTVAVATFPSSNPHRRSVWFRDESRTKTGPLWHQGWVACNCRASTHPRGAILLYKQCDTRPTSCYTNCVFYYTNRIIT
eukprot:958652-Rhodomonas_salina.1